MRTICAACQSVGVLCVWFVSDVVCVWYRLYSMCVWHVVYVWYVVHVANLLCVVLGTRWPIYNIIMRKEKTLSVPTLASLLSLGSA